MSLLMVLIVLPVNAQTKYFNWNDQEPDILLEMFKNGIPSDISTLQDLEFKRSHTRFKSIIVDQEGQLDNSINPKRSIFFNCPIGRSSDYSGMPSGVFDQDVFSMWQYIKVHGNWSNQWFTAPAAYVDAAHKHGVSVLSSWFFPWDHQFKPGQTKEQDSYSYRVEQMLKKDADGNFIYAEPLINILMYFGLDGINYNYEANTNEATADLKAFHARLYEIAKEKGFDSFHIGWYDMVRNTGKLGRTSSLTLSNDEWFYNFDRESFVSDMFMLDYSWGKAKLQETVETAELLGAPNGAFDVYAGCWMVNLTQAWYSIDEVKDVSICLWGEHGMNRMFNHRQGLDYKGIQKNYQDKLEWVFTGGSQNPHPSSRLPITTTINPLSDDTQLKTFHGMSRFVTERSSIQGELPFATNFILGNGEFYYSQGEKTLGPWYNLSAQDLCPTYRWLITDKDGNPVENINARFTHDDAWVGGNSLQLSGSVKTTATDIQLYRSELKAGANARARVIFKVPGARVGDTSNLKLILKKNSDTEWSEFDMGTITKEGWNEVELPLRFSPNDVIKGIGVRIQGTEAKDNYNVLLGELKLYNSTRTNVETPKNLSVEYLDETDRRMNIKMVWTMSEEDKRRLVYNDEVNVAYFEILVKENGVEKEVARTAAWAHYIPSVMFTSNQPELQVGVRAVSTDLMTKSDIVWKTITKDPNAPIEPEPDLYCTAGNDMTLDDAQKINDLRFFGWAKTEGAITNLDIKDLTPAPDGYNPFLTEDMVITVEPGSTFTFKAEGGIPDNLKWCRYFIYADWNGNRTFDVDTEILGSGGKLNAGDDSVESIDLTVTVPANAKPGDTRLRVRYCDAWRSHPGPCGDVDFGYTADFLIRILGDPDNVSTVETNAPTFYPNPVVDNVIFKNTNKVSVYSVSGVLMGTYTESTANLSHLERGTYIVKMENEGVTKTSKLYKK